MIHSLPLFASKQLPAIGASALLLGGILHSLTPLRAAESSGVDIVDQGDTLSIRVNGRPLGNYHYQKDSRPYLYPLFGPNGIRMTRDWPMKDAGKEDKDHPHHRSFWFTHGDVNGHDFWSESDKAGRTVHDRFLEVASGPKTGVIRSANRWVAKDGTVVATDERTLRFHAGIPDATVFDYEITVIASHGELRFGDTKEGTMAIRLAETMRLKPNKFNEGQPTGHIVNSEGVRDGATWGKRARWVDYHGPVEGQIVGVAMFDHPTNPRHPTWWHVRDYGLFAANPFGIHDFERQPAGTGDLIVKKNDRVTFRYRILLHRGDDKSAGIEEHYQAYAKEVR